MVKAKRLTVFTLVLIVIMLAVGCGEKIPEGFTEDEYEKSKKVLSTINDFLDAEISGDDAVEKLDILSDQLHQSDNSTVSLIGTYASGARQQIKYYTIQANSSYMDEVIEYRDKIKELLEE